MEGYTWNAYPRLHKGERRNDAIQQILHRLLQREQKKGAYAHSRPRNTDKARRIKDGQKKPTITMQKTPRKEVSQRREACMNCTHWIVSEYWQYWGEDKKDGKYGMCKTNSEGNGSAETICDGEGIRNDQRFNGKNAFE